jgi:hypothetical protein
LDISLHVDGAILGNLSSTLCYNDDGLIYTSASSDRTHILLTALAKKDKIQRSKIHLKANQHT